MSQVRVLFVAVPQRGHLHPLLAVAERLEVDGHDVAVFSHRDVTEVVRAAGLSGRVFAPAGVGPPGPAGAIKANDVAWLTRWFQLGTQAVLAKGTLEAMSAAVDEFRPDVLAIDPLAFYAISVAERRQLPWAGVSATLACVAPEAWSCPMLEASERVASWRSTLFAEHGIHLPLACGEPLSPWLRIVFTTAAFAPARDDGFHRVGPSLPRRRRDDPAFPWDKLARDRPIVYVSPGGGQAGTWRAWSGVVDAVVSSLGPEEAQLVVVMPEEESARAGRRHPDHVLVTPYAPQQALLDHVAAVVTHGGANTVLESLSKGRPLLVVPQAHDQPLQGMFVERAGVGFALRTEDVDHVRCRDRLMRLLDPSGTERRNAEAIAADFAQHDGASRTAELLLELGRSKKPMLATYDRAERLELRRSSFAPGFVFGTATSAFQIEGGAKADDKGPSIWDTFVRTPGKIADGSTGDVACDHFRLFREDVELMRGLGLPAYRFSVAWSRIMPEGRGRPSERGLDFYRRLVDALAKAGIAPNVTLYHWDLPQALQDRGGWTNPDVAHWFRDYAALVFDALAGGVPTWTTLNEPWCIAVLGHLEGIHAPGLRDLPQMLRASKNMLLAHGQAVRAFREAARPGAQIGIALNVSPCAPATTSDADRAAADRADALQNWMFADPIFGRPWPDVLVKAFGHAELWELAPEERALVRTPIDFLGVNYYTRTVVRDDPASARAALSEVKEEGRPRTATGWEIHPNGLHEMLVGLTRRYGRIPMIVTENGAAFDDVPSPNGFVDDQNRISYIAEHLRAARRAIDSGVDLRGFFVWSLLDNHEWAEGFTKRFGIVRVDYESQRRTPKASASWLARFLGDHSAEAAAERRTSETI
jgi:beta-glucosidase